MNILEETRTALLEMKNLPISLDTLLSYFRLSNNFKPGKSKHGIPYISGHNGYFDSEKNDKNKYTEFQALDDSFIVRISAFNFRTILIEHKNGGIFSGYELQYIRHFNNTIPLYSVIGKKK